MNTIGEDMKYEEFNLERALAGEPVLLRDGRKAYVRHHEVDIKTPLPLVGYFWLNGEGCFASWGLSGRFVNHGRMSGSDIIGMWKEPKPELPPEVWKVLDPRIKFIAADANRGVYGHVTKPERVSIWEGMWHVEGQQSIILEAIAHIIPDVPWEEAIWERPTENAKHGE